MLTHGTTWHNYLMKRNFIKHFRNSKSWNLELYGKYGFKLFDHYLEKTDLITTNKINKNINTVSGTLVKTQTYTK